VREGATTRLKIAALFSDYDGTLAPGDVSFESSRVREELAGPLRKLAAKIPVALVTSKDYHFIHSRTPFARAWACVSGLEIVLSDGTAPTTKAVSSRLLEGMDRAKSLGPGLTFELKRSSKGELLGFSVNWRMAPAPPSALIERASSELTRMGLAVFHHPAWPFLDVFGARPDKGSAVSELKRLLHVRGNVLFMGDSASDNSAFERSDVSLCVDHGQGIEGLNCRFVATYDELRDVLSSLAKDGPSLDTRTLRER
jgi:trehalose-6-phosphatase